MNDSPKPDSEGANKRTTSRYALRLRCRFLSSGKVREGVITDLSKGGAFVESEDCPLAGAQVKLQILIGGREFELPGLVRHSGWFLQELYNGYGFGVEFGSLSQDGQVLIQKIVSRLNTPAPVKTTLEP